MLWITVNTNKMLWHLFEGGVYWTLSVLTFLKAAFVRGRHLMEEIWYSNTQQCYVDVWICKYAWADTNLPVMRSRKWSVIMAFKRHATGDTEHRTFNRPPTSTACQNSRRVKGRRGLHIPTTGALPLTFIPLKTWQENFINIDKTDGGMEGGSNSYGSNHHLLWWIMRHLPTIPQSYPLLTTPLLPHQPFTPQSPSTLCLTQAGFHDNNRWGASYASHHHVHFLWTNLDLRDGEIYKLTKGKRDRWTEWERDRRRVCEKRPQPSDLNGAPLMEKSEGVRRLQTLCWVQTDPWWWSRLLARALHAQAWGSSYRSADNPR